MWSSRVTANVVRGGHWLGELGESGALRRLWWRGQDGGLGAVGQLQVLVDIGGQVAGIRNQPVTGKRSAVRAIRISHIIIGEVGHWGAGQVARV